MKTLIVPSGDGRTINGKPLIINRHPDGVLLAEKAILGIRPTDYDKVIFTVLAEQESKYNIADVIKSELKKKYPVEICILPKQTNGPADTVYQTIVNMNIEGEFAVRDSLNYIKITQPLKGNFIAGLDLTKFDEEVYKVRTKSFIILNEQNQVLDVVEKKFKSDVISVGLYGFKSVEDFILAYNKLNDSNYPIKKLYLSNIISYLIGYKNRVFKCDIVKEHEDWGLDETWKILQNRYKVCLLNLDRICFSDEIYKEISEELFKYKHYEKKSYIFYTSRKIEDVNEIIDNFKNHGINCLAIISQMPIIEMVTLIGTGEELKKAMLEV